MAKKTRGGFYWPTHGARKLSKSPHLWRGNCDDCGKPWTWLSSRGRFCCRACKVRTLSREAKARQYDKRYLGCLMVWLHKLENE